MRYKGGVSTHLEVLDTERQFFRAQLDLAQLQRDEFRRLVQLHREFGGDWQEDPPAERRRQPAARRAP